MQYFPNTNVNMELPCEATTTSSCTTTASAEECAQQCTPPQCYWGTWTPTECKPMYYNTYKDLNPGFILEPREGTTTFIDRSFFQLPAERGDQIFFYDRVRLQNVETGIILQPNVRLRMTRPFLPPPGLYFIPVTTRTPVLLYDRQLDAVLRVEGSNVNWYKAIDFLNQDYEAFFLEPVQSNRATPNLTYSDTFSIRTAYKEYLCLPPLYQHFTPRMNDLIVSRESSLPRTFRFIYVPVNPLQAT